MITHNINGEELPTPVRFGGYIKGVLDDLKKYVERDWDGILGFVGYEGDGKTNLALLCAHYLDPELSIDKIVFNSEQFEAAVEKASKGSVIVWDEADALSGHWASPMIQSIKSTMKRIRKKNLYIFLVTPTLFDLGKYFVIHRLRGLFHVYADGFERGRVRFFNQTKLRMLYMKGYKMWDMMAEFPSFIDAFGKLPFDFVVDMSDGGAYDVKKDEATKEIIRNATKRSAGGATGWRRQVLVKLVPLINELKPGGISFSEYGRIFDVNHSSIQLDFEELGFKSRKGG